MKFVQLGVRHKFVMKSRGLLVKVESNFLRNLLLTWSVFTFLTFLQNLWILMFTAKELG